ncbi:MAG: phosphoadenylyl-sulfate reductase [Halioglobus sp.]|nr:phosphoadenylyl-sulfate reductase [Halioglobus sp.]
MSDQAHQLMTAEMIGRQLASYRDAGRLMFVTSSFQTHSLVLLHILSRTAADIPVFFLNTGYLFPETLAFRDRIAEEFKLKVHDLHSAVPKTQQRDSSGRSLYASDSDFCCYLNKVQPMEAMLEKYDVWITGVRADQNDNRRTLAVEQQSPGRAMRFHPMLGWTERKIEAYISEYALPRHPLESEGYLSVGCEPCTRKIDLELVEKDPRLARWFGLQKTECGLHIDLVDKTK